MKEGHGFQKTSYSTWRIIYVVFALLRCPEKSMQKEIKDIVQNFRCVTHNFDRCVHCSWLLDVSEKEADDIKLNVTWQLVFPGHYSSLFVCPNQTRTSCIIDFVQDNLDPDMPVIFHLMLTNVHGGGANISKSVHLQSFVKPFNVSELMGDSNSTCVDLSWSHTHNLYSLLYQIRYSDNWDNKMKEVSVMGDEFAEDDITRHTICNLQPYTVYTFRVRCKKHDRSGYWSDDTVVRIRTEKDVPSFAPTTPPGGFKSTPHHKGYRHVEIFWRGLEQKYRNGEEVSYHINVYREDSKVKSMTKTTPRTSAKLMFLLQNLTYKVLIYPVNEIGMSTNSSVIVIPNQKDLPEGPKKVIARRKTKSTVKVVWETINRKDISTVTFYWCRSSAKSCLDSIKWQSVPTTVNSAVLQIHNIVNTSFLLGASSETVAGISSGIEWSQCIVMDISSHHEIVVRIKQVVENRKTSVHWRFASCSGDIFKGEVSQFIIHVCRTQSCKEKEIHTGNGQMTSLSIDAVPGETICAKVTAELKGGRKIQSDKECEKIDESRAVPFEIIIPVSVILLVLVGLGTWCVVRTFATKVQKWLKPLDIDVPQPHMTGSTMENPDYSAAEVTLPCIDNSEKREPSESLTPTSETFLVPNLDSGGYVIRDSGS